MAGGWTRDGNVQEQIDATVAEAVEHARTRMNATRGPSRTTCATCEEPIPEGRRRAIPGVRLCVACQEEDDATNKLQSSYNRRGSKDSQLR